MNDLLVLWKALQLQYFSVNVYMDACVVFLKKAELIGLIFNHLGFLFIYLFILFLHLKQAQNSWRVCQTSPNCGPWDPTSPLRAHAICPTHSTGGQTETEDDVFCVCVCVAMQSLIPTFFSLYLSRSVHWKVCLTGICSMMYYSRKGNW